MCVCDAVCYCVSVVLLHGVGYSVSVYRNYIAVLCIDQHENRHISTDLFKSYLHTVPRQQPCLSVVDGNPGSCRRQGSTSKNIASL